MTGVQYYRMTRQRKVILQALRKNLVIHRSADEVYEIVREQLPRISLGTVYRNLEILCELGEIQKLEFGGTLKRFDGNPAPHYHIRCTLCDRVDNVHLGPINNIEADIADATDYKILGHHLEFIGLCPECEANMVSPGLRKAWILRKDQEKDIGLGRENATGS